RLGILQHAVLDSVERVTLVHDRGVDRGELRDRNLRSRIFFKYLVHAHRGYGAAGPVQTRRAGDDAVEVSGVALRRNHGLASPGRAAREVGELRRLAIERVDQRLRGDRGFVHAAIGPVGDLLRILHPRSGATLMTGIGARARVAAADGAGQCVRVDVAVPGTVAHRLQLP